ncbi:MAG: adenylate/guanylate cyclase domain-containing protein [Geminicoccaceae bacterium]
MSDTQRKQRARHLAAILHADVAGYSALMRADEDATQIALSHDLRVARTIVAEYGGRFAGTAGDAFLAEFPSVVDAVRAASRFQQRRPPTGTGQVLPFRIGIHLGEVIVEGDDIYGDGINLAARVQAQAPIGGIAVTDSVREQVGHKLDIAFTDTGLVTLKNIDQPVRVHTASPPFIAAAAPDRTTPAHTRRFRLGLAAALDVTLGLACGAVYALRDWRSEPPAAPAMEMAQDTRPVVAVLPFAEPGAAEAWFANGITEDVISHLGRFPELLVLSWNAVAGFQDSTPALDDLRRDLGVRYVLRGSIRRRADSLRLSAELSDARDGLLLWSKRFESPLENVFELQDEVTGAVAGALALGVRRVEQRQVLQAPTETLDAYELVLRGRAHARRVDLAENIEARALFSKALALDPDYADAHAYLAWTHIADVWWGWSEWPYASIEQALEATDQALALDARNVGALTVRAEALFLSGQNEAALSACDRALEINPNDAGALTMCGSTLMFSDEPERAVPVLELALRIDPEPTSWALTNLSVGNYILGDYERGADTLGRGARGFDEDPSPHAMLAAFNIRLGRPDLAKREVDKTLELFPFFDVEVYVNNQLGDTERAADLLADLRAAGFE